jgi:hypothetical protein
VVAVDQFSPIPHTHEFAVVVVSDAVGAPVDALFVASAPVCVLAPENATTTSEPVQFPETRVAVTVPFLTIAGAYACHTSAVPGCAFARARSVQVRPAPVTVGNEI